MSDVSIMFKFREGMLLHARRDDDNPPSYLYRSRSFITLPSAHQLWDASISSIMFQSISSSNRGYSTGGGRVVAGVEHAVGGIVGNADIGSGGTGSQRGRECWVGSDGNGISNESEGRFA